MTNLPQKYQDVAKALIPYPFDETESPGQMMLISIDPTLPCFLCSHQASSALTAPAPDKYSGGGTAWLTFPICKDCEKRQIKHQVKD
jgi:hypothetical protein